LLQPSRVKDSPRAVSAAHGSRQGAAAWTRLARLPASPHAISDAYRRPTRCGRGPVGGSWVKRSKDAGSVAYYVRERPRTPLRAHDLTCRRVVGQAEQGRRERGVLRTRATEDASPRPRPDL